MIIEFHCEQDGCIRRMGSAEVCIHVPRLKEFVRIKDRLYKVVRITTEILTDFTVEPGITVELKREQ